MWITVDVLITKFLCAEPVKDTEVTEYSQTINIIGKLKFHMRAPTNIFCHNFIRCKTKFAIRYKGLYGLSNMAVGIVAPIYNILQDFFL